MEGISGFWYFPQYNGYFKGYPVRCFVKYKVGDKSDDFFEKSRIKSKVANETVQPKKEGPHAKIHAINELKEIILREETANGCHNCGHKKISRTEKDHIDNSIGIKEVENFGIILSLFSRNEWKLSHEKRGSPSEDWQKDLERRVEDDRIFLLDYQWLYPN